jgi:hypothetical protein
LVLFVTMIGTLPCQVSALDHVTINKDGRQQHLSGQVLVTAADGGLLLQTSDGVQWGIEPEQLVEHKQDATAFAPLTREQLAKKLLGELPDGFETYTTAHYLICHNTSREYATWCGALFERLYKGFENFWKRKGLELHPSEFPLVAIVFSDQASYAKFSKDELGEAAGSIIGYYSLRSNRMTMYDLTGMESLRRPGDKRSSSAYINQMLSRPEAELSVATVVHEATHQIAYNSGLHTRFADVPVWFSEGLAIYFETPDLKNSKGWQSIGAVNRNRLAQFREYLPKRPAGALQSLIADDKRIRDTRSALDAYAEAWALTYYLIRQKPQQYAAYLKFLSEKPAMVWDDPAARVAEFKQFFGDDLDKVDADLVRQMQRIR